MANFEGMQLGVVSNGAVQFSFTTNGLVFDDQASYDDMLAAITERIALGTKPAGVLEKNVDAVSHHVEKLQIALTTLCETYQRMTGLVKKTRASSAVMARKAMLDGMSDKVLKLFASEYEGSEEYILPDDRDALIVHLLDAMAETVTASTE